jgi:hypothetical protein
VNYWGHINTKNNPATEKKDISNYNVAADTEAGQIQCSAYQDCEQEENIHIVLSHLSAQNMRKRATT